MSIIISMVSGISENYLTLTEKELVLLLKEGDKSAFGQLYHNYRVRLYHNILKMIKSDEGAEEILQELFVKIWLNRQNLDPERSFKAYLFKISENLVYDFFRRAALNRKRESHLAMVASGEVNNVERYIYFKESSLLVNQAIENLPPRRKEIYKLCKIDGKSYQEVSHSLGISISTINEHIVKATKAVRKFFLLATNVS
ncbi:RNA polymerase sigma factor [Mucilaginibacter sp. HD30]